MNYDRKLLMERLERLAIVLDELMPGCAELIRDTISLLKEHEEVVKQWTKEIADSQLAHAPEDSHEFMSLNEHLDNEYKRGIWDGLQIAWNIISEGRLSE